MQSIISHRDLHGCPYFEQCNPTIHKRVATIKLAQRTAYHAQQQRFIQTDEFKAFARYRNGVETIPAVLRKRYEVDKMPVRGLVRCRFFFGFKIAGMNVRKLIKYMTSMASCTQKTANAY